MTATATAATALYVATARSVTRASYWSNRLGCNVSFLNEGDVVMMVEVSDIQVKVINQEGKSGWINFPANKPGAEPWNATIFLIPLTPAAGSANMQA